METVAAKRSNSFFLNSIGCTYTVLQYFPLYKASSLLNSLSKQGAKFLIDQKNHLIAGCLPTVFCSQIEHHKTIRGGSNRFILRVLHLRESLFLAVYASNELEILDLATEPPTVVDKIELGNLEEGGNVDVDFYKDETCILVGCRGDLGLLVNMRTKETRQFNHRLPDPLILVQFLKHFGPEAPAEPNFFLLSRGGTYRSMDVTL